MSHAFPGRLHGIETADEGAKALQLRRMRLVAGLLLVVMLVVFLAAKRVEEAHPWASAVAAFAEAAMVGGLADWFAVSALFRPPLGLPLAHTAIIPRNQVRIANSLGRFVEKNFLVPEIVAERVAAADPARRVAHWLATPRNAEAVATAVCEIVPATFRALDDADMRRFFETNALAHLRSIPVSPLLGRVLELLAAQNRHQALFDAGLKAAVEALQRGKPDIRQRIHEKSPKWMPRMLDEKFFNSLVTALEETLADLNRPGHEWRGRFGEMTSKFIDDLKTSPAYREKGEALKAEILDHPAVREYLAAFWDEVKAGLLQQTEDPGSALRQGMARGITALGNSLMLDGAVRQRINDWACAAAAETANRKSHTVAETISGVVKRWDAETLSRKIELQVGADLQYIRINGTVVGGLVGLLIHFAGALVGG